MARWAVCAGATDELAGTVVAGKEVPCRVPDQSDGPEQVEGQGPAEFADQPAGGGQCEYRSERDRADDQRGGARPALRRHPARDHVHGGREHGSFTEPERDASHDQRAERHHRSRRGECRPCRPPQHRDAEDQPTAVAVRERAGHSHQQQVPDEERGEHDAFLRLGPAQVVLHRDGGHRDVGAVDVGDEDRCEEQQHDCVITRPRQANRLAPCTGHERLPRCDGADATLWRSRR